MTLVVLIQVLLKVLLMVLIIGNGCLEIRMSWDSVCDYDWINAPTIIILCKYHYSIAGNFGGS